MQAERRAHQQSLCVAAGPAFTLSFPPSPLLSTVPVSLRVPDVLRLLEEASTVRSLSPRVKTVNENLDSRFCKCHCDPSDVYVTASGPGWCDPWAGRWPVHRTLGCDPRSGPVAGCELGHFDVSLPLLSSLSENQLKKCLSAWPQEGMTQMLIIVALPILNTVGFAPNPHNSGKSSSWFFKTWWETTFLDKSRKRKGMFDVAVSSFIFSLSVLSSSQVIVSKSAL